MIILSLIEAFALTSHRDLATSQVKISSMLASLFLCLIAVKLFRRNGLYAGNALSWIGERSFYFYLSHMLVLGQVQNILMKIPAFYDAQPLFIAASAAVTVAICAMGPALGDRVLKRRPAWHRATGLS